MRGEIFLELHLAGKERKTKTTLLKQREIYASPHIRKNREERMKKRKKLV